jgi:ribosomal protein S21
MIEVHVRENTEQELDKAIKRIKKMVSNDGFIQEIQDRRYYKSPSEKKREKKRKRNYNGKNKEK